MLRFILTPRERQYISLIKDGETEKSAAGKMGISNTTAASHARNIRRKLGTVNYVTSVVKAIKKGIITL